MLSDMDRPPSVLTDTPLSHSFTSPKNLIYYCYIFSMTIILIVHFYPA